jgi:hypothetical protein
LRRRLRTDLFELLLQRLQLLLQLIDLLLDRSEIRRLRRGDTRCRQQRNGKAALREQEITA